MSVQSKSTRTRLLGLWLPAIVALLSMNACQRYQVTLNERPLYEPPDLLPTFALADKALETCIAQTITDNKVVKLEQLITLRCTSAGVRSVSGLEQARFVRTLDLSNNELTSVAALMKLEHLDYLLLRGNSTLGCETLANLRNQKPKMRVDGPDHCEAKVGSE